jgi:hypothetical protein
MTGDEVSRLLAVIRARYPTSTLWDQDAALTVQAWHRTLADCPYAETQTALDAWMRVEKWAPDPAELRDAVATRVLDLPDADDAWDLARGAIASYYPGFANDHIAIPDAVRNALRSIGGIHNLWMSDDRQADREAFLRAYGIERRRIVATALLDRPAMAAAPFVALDAGEG